MKKGAGTSPFFHQGLGRGHSLALRPVLELGDLRIRVACFLVLNKGEIFMKLKNFVALVMVSWAALFLTGCATPPPPKEKVVLHVSGPDPRIWNQALNNIKNLQDNLGGADKVDVELVVYGFGIDMLKADAKTADRVSATTKTGAKIVACESTMKGRNLAKAEMNPDIGYVPAGVIELMQKQKEGWSYVKP